jgi:tetratricopeptide (TPR) repeat protein
MNRIVIAAVIVTLIPAWASGVEWPKATKEGIQAREDLLRACVGEVALFAGRPPVCVADLALLTDTNRFRVASTIRRKVLTAALRDALVDWRTKQGRPALAPVLLEAVGIEAGDPVASGFAAIIWGLGEQSRFRRDAAVAHFEMAAGCFRAAKDMAWEAACWNQIGSAYMSTGQSTLALEHYEQALRLREKALPPGHPDIAASLNNIATVHRNRGDYAKALEQHERALRLQEKALPAGHPDIAKSLSNIANVHRDRGDFAKALEYFERVLRLDERALPAGHPDIAKSLNNIAAVHHAQGHFAKAMEYHERALQLREKALPPGHPDIARSLNNIAAVHHAQGDYAKALEQHERALRLQEKALPAGHPDIAISLNNVANVHYDRGDLAKAMEYHERALRLREKVLPPGHPDIAASLNNIALVHGDRGNFAKALEQHERALRLLEKALPAGHPDITTNLHNIALVHGDRGDFAKAMEYHERALRLREKELPPGHPDIANSLNNIANVHRDRGDFAKAMEQHERALRLLEKALPPGHPDIAASLHNIALVHCDRGNFAKALEQHERALRLQEKALPPGHPDIANSLHNIALVHHNRGDFAKALEQHERALRLWEKLLPAEHPDIARSLHNIAVVHHDRGDYAKALEQHERALRLQEKALPAGHPDTAQSLHSIALVHRDRGDYAKALRWCEQALVSLRAPAPDVTEVPLNLAPAKQFRPDPIALKAARSRASFLAAVLAQRPDTDALQACVRACDLVADLQDRVRTEVLERDESRLQSGEQDTSLLPVHVHLLQLLFQLQGDPTVLRAAVTAMERSRARVLADNLTRSRASLLAGADPAMRDRELDLTSRLRALDQRSRKLLDHPGPDFAELLATVDRERRQAEDDLNKLRAEIEQKAPRYATLKYPHACTFDDARACLGANEVAVYFAPGKSSSIAVVLEGQPDHDDRSQGIHVYELPKADAFAAKITTLTDPETLALPETARELGAELYEALLGPLAGTLAGKELVIVADGDLCLLPFELLIENDKYLIEGHRIRYAPSLSVMHATRQWEKARRKPDLPLFAVGDSVFSTDDERLSARGGDASTAAGSSAETARLRGEVFRRLKHSGQEVKAVADVLHAEKEDVLTGFDATLVNLQKAANRLERARFIHFATHGVVGIGQGEQPALVLGLSADGTAPAGQRLGLDEVAGLRLNADLVVLSACETGKGRRHGNEGVSGLARAFLACGSRGVVCSMWSVDDRQTARLMTDLYTRLARGDSTTDALTAAKRSMIRDGLPPLYWAPFILIGE